MEIGCIRSSERAAESAIRSIISSNMAAESFSLVSIRSKKGSCKQNLIRMYTAIRIM